MPATPETMIWLPVPGSTAIEHQHGRHVARVEPGTIEHGDRRISMWHASTRLQRCAPGELLEFAWLTSRAEAQKWAGARLRKELSADDLVHVIGAPAAAGAR